MTRYSFIQGGSLRHEEYSDLEPAMLAAWDDMQHDPRRQVQCVQDGQRFYSAAEIAQWIARNSNQRKDR